MRGRPSRTAEATCLFRAWELARSEGRRLVTDRYAPAFLGAPARIAWRLGVPPAVDAMDRVADGLITFVAARHRFIDDALVEALGQDFEAVVVLGAGYDSRAWRFADRLAGRPLVELDHPATSARKAAIVAARAAQWPRVTRRALAIDLQRVPLAEGLRRAGGVEGRRLFVVWEGVSMYLSRAAVEQTLATLATAAPGSRVAMDLWDPTPRPGLEGRLRELGLRGLSLLGEPVDFGLAPREVAPFVSGLGLSVCDVADCRSLEARYPVGGRPLYPSMWCALLSVR